MLSRKAHVAAMPLSSDRVSCRILDSQRTKEESLACIWTTAKILLTAANIRIHYLNEKIIVKHLR